ncbi:MAG: hypothetical protein CM15mP8_3840 [Methanobacteriota archaeon]|nr:MAG: hypothetical protein CM15mP8_3840 [Euryarchaeota archaeon]
MVGSEQGKNGTSAPKQIWSAKVNNKQHDILINSNAILLDVLAFPNWHTRVKRGLGDLGTCGCCSVLIDGNLDSLASAWQDKSTKVKL